jgi:tetratricopeptide (TPR) repeat protein
MSLLVLLLVGCGVRVEVAQLPIPTPTDRPWWRLYYSGSGVVRPLALPVVTFGGALTPNADLFMQTPDDKAVLIQYRDLWLPIDYAVTWYDAPASSATITLAVYTRYDGESEWQLYDRAEARLQTDRVPAQIRDTLGISLVRSDPETVQARAEITLNAYLANGETVTLADAREFDLTIMPDPGDVEWTYDELVPQLEVSADYPLLDWRGWRGGPCALADRAVDTDAYEPLARACEAYNNGDLAGAAEPFGEINSDDVPLVADIYSVAGLLLMHFGDATTAAQAFAAAAELAQLSGDTRALALHQHNEGTALAAVGDLDGAYRLFNCVRELLNQYYDEAAINLLDVNVAYLNRDYGAVESNYWWFDSIDLPQETTIEAWLREIEQGQVE